MSIETMTKLASTTVSATSVANIEFTNIPQYYTDLCIVLSIRSSQSTSNPDGIAFQFNSDTANNYTQLQLWGTGSAVGTNVSTQNFAYAGPIVAAGNTAGIFGSASIYITGYTSNNRKTILADTATENNTTAADCGFRSNIWNSTAPINSIKFYDYVGGSLVQHSTITLYGIKNARKTAGNSIKAIGGNISFDGTYVYHSFNSSGTFTPTTNLTADYILVAGGGAGGGGNGGGGGAGGLIYRTNQSFSPSSYGITIGAGGSGGLTNDRGPSGSNSSFLGLTAIGGGGGGGFNTNAIGGAGGSGGGGSSYDGTANTSIAGGTGTAGQGNNGGIGTNGSGYPYHGAGGGGAGAVGSNATLLVSGNGGIGALYFGQYYAGGGGGGGDKGSGTTTFGTGGLGGGGVGGSPQGDATRGTLGTGGGGGGEGGGGGGANGGSGVVIIRYKG